MKKINTEAIVLKKIDYKDSDRIYTLLTKEFGKVSALAKGVRKLTSKRSGNLDSLNRVTIDITHNDSGFNYVHEAVTIDPFKHIKENYDDIVAGYYMAELIHKNVEEDHPVPEIFDLLAESLHFLDEHVLPRDLITMYFELHFMRWLGYEVILDRCTKCGKKLNNEWVKYGFDISRAGIVCESCLSSGGMEIKKNTAAILFNLYNKRFAKFQDAANIDLSQVQWITRSLMMSNLDERIKSRELK